MDPWQDYVGVGKRRNISDPNRSATCTRKEREGSRYD